MRQDRFDIHQHVTDQIVAMLEKGAGEFQLPWHRPASSAMRPVNVATKAAYRGVNILALWAAAEESGYASGLWGTYRQWAALGAQVRKGEKASYVIFYKDGSPGRGGPSDEDAEGSQSRLRLFARASAVFAAEQVENFPLPGPPPQADPVVACDAAERFVVTTGATIIHEGDHAFYRPSKDMIYMPLREAFTGTATSSPTEAYYATLFHELTHWTGHKSRCDRELGKRFGRAAYAMEELIAELGSAFICAEIGITGEPRADHAAYLADWLDILREDKKAVFAAASHASRAAAFLVAMQGD
ncbi:ArdC family protein [Methylocystis sp. JAN1]|uniref:ArdC family protein n=1 Tax=Methylocystis sp. JAN1 TaxID=3397211 RepID=UPI003FA1E20C